MVSKRHRVFPKGDFVKIATLAAGLFILLGSSAGLAQILELGTPSFGGGGCTSGSARASLSPDGQQISILFDNYIATAGGNTHVEIDRKNCDIAIPVRVPQGYSVAVFAIDYRGFAAIPNGGRVRFSADYFFAGKSSRRYSKEFIGPFNDNYTFRNELTSDVDVWSACGANVILRTQSSMVAETNFRSEETMSSIDSMDVQSGITYNFQYRKCDNTPQPPPPPPTPQPPPSVRQNIHGYIDGFQDLGENGLILNGWACAKTVNSSIAVHVYVNDAAGKGQFAKAGVANLNSEPAVSQQCQTQFQQHRFSIPFTKDEAIRYANSSVWIHGISPLGLPNLTIGQSGRVTFPKLESNIQGQVYQVTDDGSMGNMVNGHICSNSSARSVDVEVFVGGPAGIGTFVGTQKADGSVDQQEAPYVCKGYASYKIFNVQIPFNLIMKRVGQPIFVYAVDPKTGNLILLDGSNNVRVAAPYHGGA